MTTLEKLSPEDKAKVMAEATELLKKESTTKKAERMQYKELASQEIENLFVKMKSACGTMRDVKVELYNSLQTLIDSKKEVFSVNGDQKTHTISTLDGTKRVTVGYRDVSEWDGTEGAGIEKVQTYMKSLAKDVASGMLVNMIQTLLKPDKNGYLDPRRITELSKLCDQSDSEDFKDGVNIIQNAYRLAKSKSVLIVEEKTDGEKWRNVELDFSDLIFTSFSK